MKTKNYYLKFPNLPHLVKLEKDPTNKFQLESKFVPGVKASSFPEHIFPRIEGKDKDGKDCIFIDCSGLFLADSE